MNFYVYVYLDPRKPGEFVYGKYKFDFEPFYIGKGNGKRIYCRNRNDFCKNKINKIKVFGKSSIRQIVKDNLFEKEAFTLESLLIKNIGRYDKNKGPLTNFTDGGEGMSGYVMPDNVKAKIRKKRTGCRHTGEVKRKISQIKKSQKRKLSQAHIELLRKINKGRKMPDWFKKQASERMLGEQNPNWNGKAYTEEQRMADSQRMKGCGNHFYGKKHSESTKKKMSNIAKKKIGAKNPFFGKTHTKKNREKISQFFRKTWLIKKNKEVLIINNLKEFCCNNNLSYPNMRKAACGLIPDYKGWTIEEIERRVQ